MPETLYLIDAYAQIFRAYYAIRNGMRSPVTGEPTQAVFGFTGMLLKLFSQLDPAYVVVAIDAPGRTFRDDLYGQYQAIREQAAPAAPATDVGIGVEPEESAARQPYEVRSDEYKGTRESTPDDLISQVARVFEVIEGFGIPIIGKQGLEADDVIATIAQRVLEDPERPDLQIRIISKDKDLEQLLCDRVALYDIHTETITDVAALQANKGVSPDQVIDVLALMGDRVDNVPGVEGVGLKTAAQLVAQFGSIDGILANLDQIKGKRRENLEKARSFLPVSRALVTLRRDPDLPFSIEEARTGPLHIQRLLTTFQQLGFHRYQDEVKRLAAPVEALLSAEDAAPEAEDSERSEAVAPAHQAARSVAESPPTSSIPLTGDYRAITTREQLEELSSTLRDQTLISVDTETTGLERDARLCGLSFSWQTAQGVYVPILSPEPERHLPKAIILGALKPLLEDPSLPKCGHNIKFDAQVLLREGIALRGIACDSMLASILLDPAQPGHKLDNLSLIHLGYPMIPISDLIGAGEVQITMNQVPLDRVTPYAAEDADIALRLCRLLLPRLEEQGMEALMRDIEAPLTAVLAEMEVNGILCDPEELLRQGESLSGRVAELRAQIRELAGRDFQIESTQQLADVLFDTLGYKSVRKTKTGRSTDISVLEKLAALEDRHDPRTAVPRLVMEYRQLTKLISTYLGNLRASIDPADGRIRSTFHQLATATGRLASHNPNLQNIPVRSENGRQIRKAFFAPHGHLLLCADYSQVELRLLAHLSQDAAMLEAFATGSDIHTAVAAQVFGVAPDQVTREQRSRAKTINFGIIYGITPYGLARRIEDLDVAGASALIDEYRTRFPGIQMFLQECIREAMDQGYVCTIAGRRRAIPELFSANRNTRNLGERLAINSVVQGSAADLIKAAMVRLQTRIDAERLPLRIVLQVHDELVLETPREGVETQATIVCEEMERAMTLRVPLRADARSGADWMSAD